MHIMSFLNWVQGRKTWGGGSYSDRDELDFLTALSIPKCLFRELNIMEFSCHSVTLHSHFLGKFTFSIPNDSLKGQTFNLKIIR